MKKMYSFVLLMFLIGHSNFAQNFDGIVRNHLNSTTTTSNLTMDDVSEFQVTDIVPSLNPEIQHVYVQQLHKGIPIQYGTFKLTVKNSEITYQVNQFVNDIGSKLTSSSSRAVISPEDAIRKVARDHNLAAPRGLNRNASKSTNGKLVFNKAGIALEPIKVTQVYVLDHDQLRLTWRVSLYEEGGKNWWNTNVDAVTGQSLHTENWVLTCNFGTPGHDAHDHASHVHERNSVLFNKKEIATVAEAPKASFAGESYNVYAPPVESPNHGNRTIVTDPANTTASPFGWHDTNGSAGAEYTITRGNNVWAQDDSNGNNGTGFAPDGGSSLAFDYPINFSQQPADYRSAAITNLFYWNNIMHDVFYQYGFNEASGNFQENNYGNGGAGSDSVNADAQDGSGTNNANFSTPGDGGNPRMQMFLWTTANPRIDGDLDNGIIAHEYGHGISIRLVGGPNSNTLGGSEQMGEGWSDYFGLMLTMKAGDAGTDARGIGTFALDQPTSGDGIRPTPYSTDLAINGTDYSDINGLAAPHGVGYAFATILWDMTWALIDTEGFDPDFYNGTGGNNIAMALVIEGLKNTANNPGFVSGRDGILQADQDLYGGQYECVIWKAFAERGVGQDANENNNGGTNGKTDQTVSFVNPCDGGGGGGGDECSGDISSFPYVQSFENADLGGWAQATNDNLDWTRDANGTPSSSTGPSSATDGSFYIYVEASTNGTGYPTKRAILNSPCIDLSSVTSSGATLSFDYHMTGNAIGNLSVEARINNDGDWANIFSKTGAQGADWIKAEIDLAAYVGESSVQLRLNTVTGTSWQGDVAVDNLKIEASGGGGGGDNPPTGYCASNGQIITDEYISNVTMGSINNSTGASTGGYGDFTNLSTNLGSSNSISITPTWTGTVYPEAYAVWVDFNRDGDFADTNELVFSQSATTSTAISGTFGVPSGASTGPTRMRVSMKYNGIPTACESFQYGEVEDYIVVIGAGSFTDQGVIKETDGSKVANFKVVISPNPVSQGRALIVNISNTGVKESTYRVANIMGQIVDQGTISNNGSIKTSGLQSGIYVLKIQNADQAVIERFVVE